MADYEAISKVIRNAIRKEVDKQIELAYQRGYKAGHYVGRNEAWECVRKIGCNTYDGGLSKDNLISIFDTNAPYQIYRDCTASEAIDLINKYEKEKEKSCDTCDNQNKTIGCLKHIDCQRNNFKHYEPKQTKYVCNTCKHGEGEGCDSPIHCDDNNSGYESKQTETKDCKTCMYWDEPCDNCCGYDKYVPKYIEKSCLTCSHCHETENERLYCEIAEENQ